MNTTPTPAAASEPTPAVSSAPAATPNTPLSKKSVRLPLEKIKLTPNRDLRLRILKISHETGMSAPAVLERLVEQAAGLNVHWIVVRPQCGSDVGVSLRRVDEMLERVYIATQNAKGRIASIGTDQQRRGIDKIYAESMELSAAAQALAKGTIYNHQELAEAREVFNRVKTWHQNISKDIAEELSKGAAGNTKKIDDCKSRLGQYDTVLKVLTRLGFSPEGFLP